MPRDRTGRFTVAFLLAATLGAPARAGLDEWLGQIKSVGPEGAGDVEAGRAWREIVRLGPDAIPAVLTAMDDADARAANWLRTAVEAAAERALRADKPLPVKELEQFIAEKKHSSAARRLAYEWLCRADKTAPARLLPDMLQDPSPELRRDAVAVAVEKARALLDKDDKDGARAAYRKALAGACDQDQVEEIARRLEQLGAPIDLTAHFGFVREWRLAAPFDNAAGGCFKTVYPPEKGVDLHATYKGKDGAEVAWKEHVCKEPHGLVNLNKVLEPRKGAIAYAYAVVDSPAERPVEVRAGSFNALKIFLNGKEIYALDEYHHNMRMDQHAGAGVLKAGRNEILLKVCQNEQTEPWAQNWNFQVRLCDATGAAVPFTPGKP